MSPGGGSARILIVDDEGAMVRTLVRILERDYTVRGCEDPRMALELAGSYKPHLAIVDIRMPGMDGFELMTALQRQDADVRVILMTGSTYGTDEKLIRAIRERAFYYIHKPFDRQVLRTLVHRCLELCTLEAANRRYLGHLESQLAEAKAFQEAMLPAGETRLAGFEIRAAYHPCVELAGDLYDYAASGPDRVALVIADVVGHGATAAMLTAVVKSAFHASHVDGYDPRAVVERVAEGLAAFQPGLFVTLLCARISAAEGRLEFVNAGHEGGLLALPGRAPIPLASTGPLISPALSGLDLTWRLEVLPWSPESLILLYTDGIPETMAGQEEFGVERLSDILASADAAGAGLLERILSEVEEFAAGRPAEDDRTLLMARRL